MKKILLILFSAVAINAANSQSVIFSEDFNYPAGVAGDSIGGGLGTTTALGDTIWKKHSGTATGGRCVKYATTSLGLAGYAASGIGGSATFQHTVGSADINGYIGQSITTGSVYTSFLLKIDSTGGNDSTCDYFFHYCDLFGAGSLSNFRGRLFICAGSDSTTKFKIGLSKGTAAKLTAAQVTAGAQRVYSSTEYNIGQTYIVILKYTFNAATTTDDVLSLYVLPTTVPLTEPTPDVTFADPNFSDLTKIQSVVIRQGSIGKTFGTIDGIRVFTTWDAATVNVLPNAKISNFAAIGLKDVVNVNWSAIITNTNADFTVQRSVDGVNFENVSTLSSTTKTTYSITDKNLPKANALYYRLKTVNANGQVEYSAVQKVTLRNIKVSVSPNPTVNELSINATSTINAVEVFDLAGKKVYGLSNTKANSVKVNVSNLINGTYIVKTTIDGESTTEKIIVKH